MHLRKTGNVGDLACSPGAYFDFGKAEAIDIGQEAPACALAVLGGGQIYQQVVDAAIYRTAAAKKRVVWGVGITKRQTRDITFDILNASCALIGSRNWRVPGCAYVPCASAMSPLFDQPAAPRAEVVLFTHARKSTAVQRPDGIPTMDNHGASLEDVIAFLASGETVVTNSYHGTYWAMCLGRRVLCLPFSNKFSHFRTNPVTADPADWLADLGKAEARPEMLTDARRANQQFYEKVMAL